MPVLTTKSFVGQGVDVVSPLSKILNFVKQHSLF
jgi:hypothetical protein